MTIGPLALDLKQLQRQQAKNRAQVKAWDSNRLQITPSCPPSTTLQMRGGWVVHTFYWLSYGSVRYIPSVACDLTDSTKTGYTANFTNANWYHGAILCIYLDLAYNTYEEASEVSQWFELVGTTVEYETAGEAEGQIDALLNGSSAVYRERIPLCGLVLKNDGNTEVDGAILPVDAINRGRSYLFRDARGRNWIRG